MIKVKLIEKIKDKSGDSKREVKSEKEIKKSKDYKTFISVLSKAFSIPKNKFILIVLTEDEDEYPINDQEDLNSFIEEAREFMIIMEESSQETKSSNKSKKNEKTNSNSDIDDDKKKENEDEEEGEEDKKNDIKFNLEITDQEIETIINSVKMPDIDNINDKIEFDIEKYKKYLNNMNKTKIADFKKIFEFDIKSMITEKSNIIKQNISQFLLSTKKEQEEQIKSIEETSNIMKEDFNDVIKTHNDNINIIGDLISKQELKKSEIFENKVENQNNFIGGDNIIVEEEEEVDDVKEDKALNIIKFDEEEIKHEIRIKGAKFFFIDNIAITNVNGNKAYDPLYFSIDTNRSSKNISFLENSKDIKYHKYHRLTLNGPLEKGEKLNNSIDLYNENPQIGEYTLFIYVKENPNTENLSKPLKIIINIIGDPEN